MSLTKNRDTDILVLLKLSDNDLKAVCRINKYVHSICTDDNFWRMKLIDTFKEYINFEDLIQVKEFLEFNTWKDLYIYLNYNDLKRKQIVKNIKTLNITNNKLNEISFPSRINKEELIKKIKRSWLIAYPHLLEFDLEKDVDKLTNLN